MLLDHEAVELVVFIMNCEGGGFGSNRMLPSVLMKETAFYFNARTIVLSEQRKIERYRKKENERREK